MLVIEILVELALEVFGSIFFEALLALTHALDEDKGAKVPAVLVLALTGVILGASSVVVAPTKVLPSRLVPGVSLLAVPVVIGLAMELWGRSRSSRSKNVSHLGTWYGGGALGLGLAVGRLVGLAFAADVAAL